MKFDANNKSMLMKVLVVINVVLLTAFVMRIGTGGVARAQANAGRAGDYLMIPGEVVTGVNAVVYVLDQSSHQLSAMIYDDGMRQLVTMQPRDIDADFDGGKGRR